MGFVNTTTVFTNILTQNLFLISNSNITENLIIVRSWIIRM